MIRQHLDYLATRPPLLCVLLLVAVASLYGPFLWNPLVYDDISTLSPNSSALNRWLVPSVFELRWVAYGSFAWTKAAFGWDLPTFRIGNLLLHAANAALIFLFLRSLFHAAFKVSDDPKNRSYYTWLAFFCGVIYALHPISVYAAAYLIQRSTLFALLFVLLMWIAYLEGLVRDRQSLILVSAVFYYLAVFSKELAVMAPAVVVCLTLVLQRPSTHRFKRLMPTFVLYVGIAFLVVFKARNVIGHIYEPRAQELLTFADARLALPLSVINQSYLFFKYLFLWLLPNPAWMAVDICQPFPERLSALPQAVGPVLFVLYAALAVRLLLDRERVVYRLAGFGMVSPLVMFVPEFSTVRIQESFVLYRSYLWFAGAFAVLPVVMQRFDIRKTLIAFASVALVLVPLAWNRLTTFSDLLLLWNDAAGLVDSQSTLPGVDRIYYNRGNALLARKRVQDALNDYTTVIRLNPKHTGAYNNRGTIHYEAGRYMKAIEDFRRAAESSPTSHRPYFGLGMSYLALGNDELAEENLRRSCDMGFIPACVRLYRLEDARDVKH